MNIQLLKENIEGIDIYILDQIVKDNYQPRDTILDAGCGTGRNLTWFYNNNFEIHGVDNQIESIAYCKEKYVRQQEHFKFALVEELPYESNNFDHIICNAVLHFAENLSQFWKMFDELVKVLKPQGSLLIRMASNFGIENQVKLITDGVYALPDGSTRFLLDDKLLRDLQNRIELTFLENVKTTIVHNQRSMTTLLLRKEQV
ncbi:class I SAM-dependent methyltransferase [Aureibaculum algae]|uniref:Class I SAM-dependent methyltransferase n=1 Tax=Aureibaculum algae TaxID=2584122 RepID=A0A5B7TRR6_9FLAO|nr:class I SAM-dependent methyltransferase [Aureibaculum algae]QCX39010.1 class I SAM-dependent methyltransferase [Aureibaculum algae]